MNGFYGIFKNSEKIEIKAYVVIMISTLNGALRNLTDFTKFLKKFNKGSRPSPVKAEIYNFLKYWDYFNSQLCINFHTIFPSVPCFVKI